MLKAQVTMNEHSEKETASWAHEHLKGKHNTSITPWACRMIRTFWYWFGAVQKRAYFGFGRTYDVYWYGYRHTIGMGTGVRWVRVRVYRWNGKGVRTSIQRKLYCDTYRICISYIWLEFLDTFDHWIIKKLLWLGDGSVVIKEAESEGEDSRQGNSRQLFTSVFTSGGFGNKLHQN